MPATPPHRGAFAAVAALLTSACAARPPAFVYPRSPHVEFAAPVAVAAIVPASAPSPARAIALNANFELGVPLVETYVDGRGPYRFVLASGSTAYAIDERIVDELKLERVDLASGGKGLLLPNVRGAAYLREAARIAELRVGPLVERDTGAMVFDLSLFERLTGTRIDGWIPAVAFEEGLLTLDFVAKTATVAEGELPEEDGEEVLDFKFGWELPCIEIEIGEESCSLLVDTGSRSGLSVPFELEESLRFLSPPVVAGALGSTAGVLPNRMGRLDGTIALGRHLLAEPVVALIEGDRAVAGTELLDEFRITFDFGNERVRFERAGAEPIRSPSVYGLSAAVLRKDGAWTITYVRPDSRAARAGVKVGDRIEAVEGRPIADVSDADWSKMLRTKDALMLRLVDAAGTRDVAVDVVTFVK